MTKAIGMALHTRSVPERSRAFPDRSRLFSREVHQVKDMEVGMFASEVDILDSSRRCYH